MPELKPGSRVVLTDAPPVLLQGLPEEDRSAIRAAIGRPVTFVSFSCGQAEVEFTDAQGDEHTIWVDADLLRPGLIDAGISGGWALNPQKQSLSRRPGCGAGRRDRSS